MRAALKACGPDLIWLEHPFLWNVVHTTFPSKPVVYSAHDVEWKMNFDRSSAGRCSIRAASSASAAVKMI